jgi:hypothetical protein
MPESKSVQISPAAYAVIRNLRDTSGVMATVCRVLDQQNELTTGYIQQNFLSGPGKKDLTTLAVVTGLLRRSAHPVPARIQGGVIFSGLGSNVLYAGAHEFGVDKEITVPAHTMRNSIRDRFDAGGTAVDRFTALRMGILSKKQASKETQASGKYVFARKRAKQVLTAGQIMVKAHQMHMRLPARRCFSRGIEARLETYGTALSAAIVREWGQS